MLELKHILLERKLDLPLPIYPLTKEKRIVKSTFIDRNRLDTAKPFLRDSNNLSDEDTKGKQLTKKINNGGK